MPSYEPARLLQHIEVPDRVPMVLPLLLEDHVQALKHGVFFPGVAGAIGRDAVALQLLGVAPAITSRTSPMRSPAQVEHLGEGRVGVWVDAPSARTGEPRSSDAPRVVRVGDPLHHPPQPAVRGQHKVTLRLHEAPLAVDLLVQDRFGQLPRPGDGPAPDPFDHRPGVSQALGVCALSLSRSAFSLTRSCIAAFHACSLRGPPPRSRCAPLDRPADSPAPRKAHKWFFWDAS